MIEPAKRNVEQPQKALEVVGVPTNSIRQGDVLRVLPGERVPVDGEILEGACSLDESMLTGESALVNKAEGSHVCPCTFTNPFPGLVAVSGSYLLMACACACVHMYWPGTALQ